MSRIERTERHRVFPVERRGDTLVVAPRGDAAGFGQMDFQVELSRLLQLAERPDIRHLIVDFDGSNYYGATMIGAIVDLGQTIRSRGGQIAFCNASQDMRDVFRLLKLDAHWRQFETRPEAVRAIATESRGERMRAHPVLLVSAVALLMAAGAAYFSVKQSETVERDYYESQRTILLRAQELRNERASPAEWKLFAAESRRTLTPMIADLERTASIRNRVRQYLLFSGRDHLLPVMEYSRTELFSGDADRQSELHLARAADWLKAAELRMNGESLAVAEQAGTPTAPETTTEPTVDDRPVRTAVEEETREVATEFVPAEAERPALADEARESSEPTAGRAARRITSNETDPAAGP